MQVRVRHEDDIKSKPFGEIPLTDDDCETVLSTIKRWGGFNTQDYGVLETLSGQFVYGDDGAYFEIMIHYDEDE